MKNVLLLLAVIMSAGCAETFQDYLEQPQTILRDPHYAKYQDAQRELEHAYLINEIDYVEYLEKKKDLDERYAREVQDREAIVGGE